MPSLITYDDFKINAMNRISPEYRNPHTFDACGNDVAELNCKIHPTDFDVANNYIKLWNCVKKRSIINDAFRDEIMNPTRAYPAEIMEQAKKEYASHKYMENAIYESYFTNCEKMITDRRLNIFDLTGLQMIKGGDIHKYKYLKYKHKYQNLKKKLKER